MDVVVDRVAGLDISKADVKVCVRVPDDARSRARYREQTRTFTTMTADLLRLGDWLAACEVELVAMEATGDYWKPVFYLLEERFTVWLVNARDVKKVPGRKTDVKDAQWLAQLAAHGLGTPSFVPPPPIWPSPESVETSNWWILFWARSSCLVPAAVRGVPPAAGVNAGRRPPAGLGVDPGEDGATLGSRKRGARSRRLFRWVLGGGVAALVGDRGEHAQRRVAPVVVVVLDPAGDRGAGVGFGGELLHAAQLELQGGVPGLDHGVV